MPTYMHMVARLRDLPCPSCSAPADRITDEISQHASRLWRRLVCACAMLARWEAAQ